MAEHKQNAYIAGASIMCGLSTLWWVGWGVAVGTAPVTERRVFFTVWSYLALVPFVAGAVIFVALIRDWPLPGLPRPATSPSAVMDKLIRKKWKESKKQSAKADKSIAKTGTTMTHEYVARPDGGESVLLSFAPKYELMRCCVRLVGSQERHVQTERGSWTNDAWLVTFPDGFQTARDAPTGDYRAEWEIGQIKPVGAEITVSDYRVVGTHDFPYTRPAQELPPATRKSVGKALEEKVWPGQSRYRSESVWSVDEQRAYLTLQRRDSDIQTFRVTVTDPTGIACSHMFGQAGSTIEDMYPDKFPDAPAPLVSGDYKVEWQAMVEGDDNKPYMGKVDESSFRRPY